MSEQDKNIWDSLACDIVDGEVSDIGALKQNQEIVNKLLKIAQLSKAFGHKPVSDHSQQSKSEPVLFQWGHLEVWELLGEGTHGTVYLAHDPILNRQVALKIIKQADLAPYQARAFIDEARRMAKVRNRHVLAIHGANVFDGQVGFWADWIDGHELSPDMINTNEDLLTLIEALGDALRAVHEAGLVHGDVKPANVMQDHRGRIILMDFGAGSEQLMAEHMLSGTPRYMAPELFQDEGISPASDIYALGTMLYYMASGEFPLHADNLAGIKQGHKTQSYRVLNHRSNPFNNALCQLINDMLAPNQAKRPTAQDIIKRISLLKSAPQRRQKRVIVSTLFFILISGIVFTSWGFYRASQAQQETMLAKQQTDAINAYFKSMLTSASALGTGREVSVADLLLKAQEQVAERFEGSPLIKADISTTIARTLLSLNMLEEAKAQFRQVIAIKQTVMANNHPDILNTRLTIAMIENRLGNYKDSMAICDSVLALPNISKMIKNQAIIRLAENYSDQGYYEQAETMLLPLLNDIEPPQTATSNNSMILLTALTNMASRMAEFEKAEQYARQGIDWLSDYPREQDRNLRLLKNSLTISLLEQGKTREALQILEPMLQDIATEQGKETYLYVSTLTHYAVALRELDQHQEALAAEEQALALSFLIEGHKPDISVVLGTNIANSKVALGKIAEAEQLMRDSWQLAIKELGESHHRTLTLEYNLAELLNNTNRPEEARQWATKTIEKATSSLGPGHIITLLSQDNLAVSLRLLGHNEAALPIHTEVLAGLEKILPAASSPALLAQAHYIDALLTANQTTAAREQLKNRLKTLEQKHPSDHPDIVAVQQQLQALDQNSTQSHQ